MKYLQTNIKIKIFILKQKSLKENRLFLSLKVILFIYYKVDKKFIFKPFNFEGFEIKLSPKKRLYITYNSFLFQNLPFFFTLFFCYTKKLCSKKWAVQKKEKKMQHFEGKLQPDFASFVKQSLFFVDTKKTHHFAVWRSKLWFKIKNCSKKDKNFF